MSEASPFPRRMLIAWIGAVLLSFAASLYFMGGGGTESGVDAVGPSAFSRSAIGYAGLADILHRIGIPVVKSRYEALTKLGPGSVLVIAEPLPGLAGIEGMAALAQAPAALLILPKWQGEESRSHAGWLARAQPWPMVVPAQVLALAVPGARLVRQDKIAGWTVNRLGKTPVLDPPVQLIRSDRLRPIVGNADGMLLGELDDRGRRLLVLADPDVLANHGIARGENAAFAVALIEALGSGRVAPPKVVFDETLHGYVAQPASPARLLLRFPFVFATAQAALGVLLLLWASLGRFGAPEATPPALAAGKTGLIRNAAALLDHAGHRPVMVQRYVQATLREAARLLHAPRGLDGPALIDWLKSAGKARGVSLDCAGIIVRSERRTDDAGLAACARDIYQWKGEIVDGPSADSRAHRRVAARGEEGGGRAG